MDAALTYFGEHPVACIVTIGVIALLIYGMSMNQKNDGGGNSGGGGTESK